MIARPEQRRAERLTVPRHCRGAGRDGKVVHLVDLSAVGARIEHGEPFHGSSSFSMDLPRALGGGRVQVEVVWSRPSGRKPVVEGKSGHVYQSGLAFPHSTFEEQAALRVALIRIAGGVDSRSAPRLPPARRGGPGPPGARERPLRRGAHVAASGDRGAPLPEGPVRGANG